MELLVCICASATVGDPCENGRAHVVATATIIMTPKENG